jgi:chromosome segregation ATPase
MVKQRVHQAFDDLNMYHNELKETIAKYDREMSKLKITNMMQEDELKKTNEIYDNLTQKQEDMIIMTENVLQENDSLKTKLKKTEEELSTQRNKYEEAIKQIEYYKSKNEHEEKELLEFRNKYENVIRESEYYKSKLHFAEEDIILLRTKYDEAIQINEQLQQREEEIITFRDNLERMTKRQSEVSDVILKLSDENEGLKNTIIEKNADIDLLIVKIENLKLDYQSKLNEIQGAYNTILDQNKSLSDRIEKELKVKIKALKNKLKEKVDLLARYENQL